MHFHDLCRFKNHPCSFAFLKCSSQYYIKLYCTNLQIKSFQKYLYADYIVLTSIWANSIMHEKCLWKWCYKEFWAHENSYDDMDNIVAWLQFHSSFLTSRYVLNFSLVSNNMCICWTLLKVALLKQIYLWIHLFFNLLYRSQEEVIEPLRDDDSFDPDSGTHDTTEYQNSVSRATRVVIDCDQQKSPVGYYSGSKVNDEAPKQVVNKTLILFEDVDTVFDEDRGFISTILKMAETTKWPIILTSNSEHFILSS